jgi:hypothetical protein
MPYRIDVYIGSDNASRKICEDYLNRVVNWANGSFPDGYTMIRGQGCYRGVSEDTVLINALSDTDVALKESLEKLKQELGQEAILLTKTQIDVQMI